MESTKEKNVEENYLFIFGFTMENKEKNIKETDFFMFGYPKKNTKKKKNKYNQN